MLTVNCPSCGFKKPEVVELHDGRHVARCPSCGLNTGPKKNPTRAANAWNAMSARMK